LALCAGAQRPLIPFESNCMNILANLRRAVAVAAAISGLAAGAAAAPVTSSAADLSTDSAVGQTVKWNPGHYVDPGISSARMIDLTLNEIAPFPFVRGVVVRYNWRELETAKGVYDFSQIQAALDKAAAKGKRIFLVISTKSFRSSSPMPDYLHTAEYDGGAFTIQIYPRPSTGKPAGLGSNVALWNNGVRDRLIALVTALAERFNKHDSFEGIAFTETALGTALKPLSTAKVDGWYANLKVLQTASTKAFSNTVVMQFLNWPPKYTPAVLDNMMSNGVGISGPDIFVNDAKMEQWVWPMYEKARGTIPVGPSVQNENFFTTYLKGPYNPPSVKSIYDFGRGRLHANYMIWTRITKDYDPWSQVLKMFKSSSFPKDLAGGLSTTCPTTFGACVSKLNP
jgi:hypothetical protein